MNEVGFEFAEGTFDGGLAKVLLQTPPMGTVGAFCLRGFRIGGRGLRFCDRAVEGPDEGLIEIVDPQVGS